MALQDSEALSLTNQGVDAPLVDPSSLTYEPYFGLREKPFSLSPDPRFFFTHSSLRATFDSLVAGIRRREGILVLTGEVGTGKTTLCRAVLRALDRKTFAAFVPDPFLSREDLLKTLLVDFGVVSIDEIRSGRLQGSSRTDLSYPLYEFLTSLQALHAFAVVIIDEAQNLPPQLLEEIRILADMEDRQKLIQVLLVGQPELDASLSTFEMRQLRQRLSLQCELVPLGREDVKLYISHRLMVAGSNHTIRFAEAAVDRIWGASNGIPRIVNLVCDGALARAAQDRTALITTDHVAGAMRLLRLQEPPRWQDPQPVTVQPVVAPVAAPSVVGPPVTVAPVFIPPVAIQPVSVQPVSVQPVAQQPAAPVFQPEEIKAPELRVPRALSGDLDSPALDNYSTERRPGLEVFAEERPSAPAFTSSWPKVLAVSAAALVMAFGGWAYVRWTATRANAAPQELKAAAPRTPPVSQAARVTPPPPEVTRQEPAGGLAAVPAQKPASAAGGGSFAIQMATLQTSGGAARAIGELMALGHPAYAREVTLSSGQTAYAVFLGPYVEMAEAEHGLEQARQVPGYAPGRIINVAPASPGSAVP